MEYRELGRSGVKIPEIGVGVWQYRGGVEPLRRGIELGANLIDTAEIYGTEGVVGEAIKGMRDRVFLATKMSGDHLRRKDVLKAADASLKRLGTDVIDLYQVHWPDSRVPIEETMGAMEELVDAGKVRYVGVSNFSVQELKAARQAMKKHAIVEDQVLYNLLDRDIERDLLPYCQEQGVTILAYSPLARGAITTKPLLRHRAAFDALQTVARETGKTVAQVALNWCNSHPMVVSIPKSNHVQRVEENCGASGWRLTPAQVEALDRAFK